MYSYPKKSKFTQAVIDAFPLSADGKQITVYDLGLPGFALRIGATSKTFIVYKRVANGAPKRITLGKYGQITLAQAKTLAQQKLADLTSGIDPIDIKKTKRLEAKKSATHTEQTLEWLLDEYTNNHLIGNKGGKDGTLKDMLLTKEYFSEKKITLLKKVGDTWQVNKTAVLSNWLDRPFREITREEVKTRFQMFSVSKPTRIIKKNGLQPITRTHQLCFKYLNSAYNYIIPILELDIKENFHNPVDVLSAHKLWKKAGVRTNMLEFRKEEFSLWWNALIDYREHNEVVSDYIMLSLLQCGRSIDIAPLLLKNVDFELEEIKYLNTKNELTYKFPVSKLGMQILKRRRDNAINEYVFGYADSDSGHVPKDCKFHFANLHELSGKLISHHDLRRTWATAASWLDINERIYNFLLKHKMNDVNEHYLMANYDKIKQALQKVENMFIKQAKDTAKL